MTGASPFLIGLLTCFATHDGIPAVACASEHTGAVSNDKNPRCCRDEPGDHALGPSRGGLSTKIHAAVDGRGRGLATR